MNCIVYYLESNQKRKIKELYTTAMETLSDPFAIDFDIFNAHNSDKVIELGLQQNVEVDEIPDHGVVMRNVGSVDIHPALKILKSFSRSVHFASTVYLEPQVYEFLIDHIGHK